MSTRNAKDTSTRLHISVSSDVVAQIDAERGDVPRSKWIVRALERQLKYGAVMDYRPVDEADIADAARVPTEKDLAVAETKRRVVAQGIQTDKRTMKDANAEYTRMMAERQRKLQEGR